MSRSGLAALIFSVLLCGCQPETPSSDTGSSVSTEALAATYATPRLDPSLDDLTDSQREMVPDLIAAAQAIDAVFWEQAYGNRDSLLQSIPDPVRRRHAERNYGPWDRLRNDKAFVQGAGPRPPGANFYPVGVSAENLKQTAPSTPGLMDPETMVRRLPDGSLTALPYHLFFGELMTTAAYHLRDAASLSSSPDLRRYLEQRASSLVRPDSAVSDVVAPESPALHVLIGALPTGEDHLLGVKASATALVLRRNDDYTQNVRGTLEFLSAPAPESAIPDSLVPAPTPDFATAYDALYVAGGLNTGSKQVVHSFPSDLAPEIADRHLFVFPNVARAKVDSIFTPLAEATLVSRQRAHVSTDAFLDHTLLANAVRSSFSKPRVAPAGGVENALGLSLAMSLAGQRTAGPDTLDYAVTSLVRLLHTAHLDSTSTPGRAAAVTLNALLKQDALSRDDETGLLAVHPAEMARALPSIVQDWIRSPDAFVDRNSSPSLLNSIGGRIDTASVPKALAFRQGLDVLDLESTPTAAR